MLGKPEALISFVNDRPGHDLRYAVDTQKINSELGWKPSVKFSDGLRYTINWYLENKIWWQDILNKKYLEENKKADREYQTYENPA